MLLAEVRSLKTLCVTCVLISKVLSRTTGEQLSVCLLCLGNVRPSWNWEGVSVGAGVNTPSLQYPNSILNGSSHSGLSEKSPHLSVGPRTPSRHLCTTVIVAVCGLLKAQNPQILVWRGRGDGIPCVFITQSL